ncbi:hypothetical protein [Zhongshania aquimaris]|uniref:Uncharacterized protein n=1 Tax=Zhongshania aquimaris TaxID=2857107 RepID=A0ABS6VQN5_9GAMM|nr:hypothetical protein [Zhongshania aquimaris]MBW2940566.1 hypothetical protein [Zhongshania aquimaris]
MNNTFRHVEVMNNALDKQSIFDITIDQLQNETGLWLNFDPARRQGQFFDL